MSSDNGEGSEMRCEDLLQTFISYFPVDRDNTNNYTGKQQCLIVYVLMRDERRKEERSKQGQTNNKAKQHRCVQPKYNNYLLRSRFN